MPTIPSVWITSTLTNAAESAANTETVVATVKGINSRYAGQQVLLNGWLQITPGTTATSITLRLRQSSLTGTLVSVASAEAGAVAAGKIADMSIDATDTPGEVSQFAYVLTAQGAGEGTAATFQACSLQATVF